jgi:hypothetical protein
MMISIAMVAVVPHITLVSTSSPVVLSAGAGRGRGGSAAHYPPDTRQQAKGGGE